MARLLLLLVAFQCIVAVAAAAPPLCPDARPAEARPMRESDFELYRAERNLELLGSLTTPFNQAIAKAADRQAVDPVTLPGAATFASSYPNALNQIHGTLLKQRALMAEQELQIAKAHRNAREARAAQANLDAARSEFCHYLGATRFID